MLGWLGLQVISFQTPEVDGVLMRRGDDALVWVVGALPRRVEGPYDAAEQTLSMDGSDLQLRLVGGEGWTGRLTWQQPAR